MTQIKNCRYCRKTFKVTSFNKYHCENCLHIHEDRFDKVRTYLEQHPLSNIFEVQLGTGVELDTIRAYVNEYRLREVTMDERKPRMQMTPKRNSEQTLRQQMYYHGLNSLRVGIA